MMQVRMQVMPLENGLTRVLDLGSKLWALYDSESGVFHTGFYFAEVLLDPTPAPNGPGSLEDIPGIERVIEQSDIEVCR
jgi:hypothetical protein